MALAEYIAGSESAFAEMMNQQAEALGLFNTQFRNATGLPAEGHYTSAWDLALLTQAYIRQFPENYAIYAEKSLYLQRHRTAQPQPAALAEPRRGWRQDWLHRRSRLLLLASAVAGRHAADFRGHGRRQAMPPRVQESQELLSLRLPLL